jgi:heavy metal sensor kinase
VGISLEDTMESLNRLLIVMILAGLGLLLLASLGGSFIINRALHPVKSVVKTAQVITADDLSLRITAQNRQDEIGALVATFNDMIARLEKSVKKIRQFSGDVSHELRTPLTIIRGEVEVLLRKERTLDEYIGTVRSVLEESLRMEKIIDDLLFLSRVEALEKSQLNQDVRLDTVLSQVIDDRRAAVQGKSLELHVEDIPEVEIKGNEHLLERMLVNVMDNAIRYTPEGGKVSVNLKREHSAAHIEISDTGVGIPEDALPLIFDRFYVVDKSRSKETGGSGLGLSIVKWIAENHGAEVEVRSEVGKGTTFRIVFPLG